MQIVKHYFTKNECYKVGQKLKPVGFMIHSTGANNPYLWRYIDDPVNLGKNKYNNHWNQFRPDGRQVCVHGFIGKDKKGNIKVYNTLPTNMVAWNCGYPGNNMFIAYEICEDNLKSKTYFNKVMDVAMELAAHYCKQYGWDVSQIVSSKNRVLSHAEGHKKGLATNHGDIDYWLKKFGKDMTWFRNGVKQKMIGKPASKPTVHYQVYRNGAWGKNITGGYAGADGYAMKAFRINATNKDGTPFVAYRLRKLNGGYYNWQYDRTKDKNSEDFAGDKKSYFDRIQMELRDCPGWEVRYRVDVKGVGWLPWVKGYNTYDDNGYAGIDGKIIQRVEVEVVKI